ncbi:MAG TPA: galactose oxidase early set domain-containing protein, partial [Acidimicrobiia bacterium]|nr:galactose oxidase early set domain-containing protein [Acidimicrobiia bacterium]
MSGLMRRWRAGVVGFSAVLTLGTVASGVSAQAVGAPDVVGQWTPPFEEGTAAVPRCQSANDGSSFVVCKPTAVETAVLNDGRIFYFNGIESQENSEGPTATSLAPSSRNSQARVLDLRTGTPEWIIPKQGRGGMTNPNIKPGHKSEDDPLGEAGVPGRPGDGWVGSAWGQVGGPAHDPTSSPDDPADNDGDLFCADITMLPDGRLLMAGGTDWYNQPSVMDRNQGDPADVGVLELEGLRNALLFDPKSNSFENAAPMKYGRWYPHIAVGPDGNVTVFGGVTQLISDTQSGQVRRTETYHADTNTWEENYVGPASENELPLQPRILLAPNGKFFYAAVGQTWGPFGQSVDEAMTAFFQFFDPKAKTWSISGLAPLGARSGAFVVPLTMAPPYDQMTVVTWGGVLGPTPGSWLPANPLTTLTTIDANGNVTNRMSGNLNHPRWYSSGVLLPDGQVLAVGGDDKDDALAPGMGIPVKIPELYDPATGEWTEVAGHTRARGYHNSALLLPDMRVLLGGNAPIAALYGGANQDLGGPFANNDNDPSFEIWSPPYLFRGARPSVTRVQQGISYGETFNVTTPEAADIESIVLMRTPSPEHVNDSDQRALRLDFTRSGSSTLTATAPPSGNVAPPGSYYLVVNKKSLQGPIPSVASMVSVGTGTNLENALKPFPDDAPAQVGGSATPDEDTSNVAKAQQHAS